MNTQAGEGEEGQADSLLSTEPENKGLDSRTPRSDLS